MEIKYKILLIILVVAVSGCTDLPGSSNSETSSPGANAENGGLEILSFQTAQSELREGQKTQLKLTLRNHHVEEISMESIEIYNYEPLIPEKNQGNWEDRCTPSQIRRNLQSNPPTITCEWTVEAPEEIGDFNSKTAKPKLQILYNSKVSNSQNPVNLQFKPFEDISSNSAETKEVDNGEVKLSISAENPAPIDTGSKVDVSLQNSGHGEVIEESENSLYTVNVEPKSLFDDRCNSEMDLNPPIDDTAEFSCIANSESADQVERKLLVSASYKYQKTPTTNIQVVK